MMQASLFIRDFKGYGTAAMEDVFRKIKNFIAFCVFMGIIVCLFGKITWIFRLNTGEAREDILGFRQQGKVDVVLCGGSTLLRGYQPLEVYDKKGFTSYNYATTFEKGNLLKAFIEESRRTNEALLYVCDLRAMPLAVETIEEPSLRNWSDSVAVFSPTRLKAITSYLFSRNWRDTDIVSFYFDIAKYHTNYGLLANPYQWSYVNPENIYNLDKGFAAVLDHVPFERPQISAECGELSKRRTDSLNELMDYCDKEELQVLFIVSPYVISESDWMVLNACGKMIRERGYDFVNFNHYYDEIGIDFETDFHDFGHLNYLGSEKYTKYLMNYLSDNYDLPDHRGDEDYALWDDDYIAFSALQAEWKESNEALVEEHLAAREAGKSLCDISDFSSWSELIQNENYTVIIVKNQLEEFNTDDVAFHIMALKWGIDFSQTNYIGIWQGEKCLFSDNSGKAYEGDIVKKGGVNITCSVNAGETPQIIIDETDYYRPTTGIKVLIYDNNYREIMDNVTIQTDGNKVYLIR